MSDTSKDYLLGVNDKELERLGFQHSVWKNVSDSLFNRIGVKKGWKVLDAGSGPGFVSLDLLERIGQDGELTALEPSKVFLDHFKRACDEKNIKNAKYICGTAETAELPKNYFDLIYSRWVIGFVPDPDRFISNLAKSLKPGGIIVIEDYAFDKILLYPQGGDYDKISPAVKEYWKSEGGDLCIAPRIPPIYKKNGIETVEFHPNQIAGGPETGIFEWHNRFITHHVPLMAERKIISKTESDAILADWKRHKENPEAIFFSPMVVDVVGRKNSL